MKTCYYNSTICTGRAILLVLFIGLLPVGVAWGQSSFLPYEPGKEKPKMDNERVGPVVPSGETSASVIIRRNNQVQEVLKSIRENHPELVERIPENGRYYLLRPHASAVSEDQLERLQEAFYLDVTATCKFYGVKYLLDWRVLVAKSARETFWGTSFLSNYASNYFGIWQKNKPWICDTFGFCGGHTRNDPAPTEFVTFPGFEKSLWMFIHTIYSFHYRERLPDRGERVYGAIRFERTYGIHYWQDNHYGNHYADKLNNEIYDMNHMIYSWSEHEEGFNLCIECTRASDKKWVYQVMQTGYRIGQQEEERSAVGPEKASVAIGSLPSGTINENPE